MNNFNLLAEHSEEKFIYIFTFNDKYAHCAFNFYYSDLWAHPCPHWRIIFIIITSIGVCRNSFSTNRVTAGQQQSTFGEHQGPTSLLPSSNQSVFAKIPEYKTLGQMILYPIGILST
jgi:hypothetical protein